MLLDHDFVNRWAKIVTDVDTDQCPIECVKKVIFRLDNRRQKTFNLDQLRRQNIDEESIERAVTSFITQNESHIMNMELVIDAIAVADIIQPETDKLLKGM